MVFRIRAGKGEIISAGSSSPSAASKAVSPAKQQSVDTVARGASDTTPKKTRTATTEDDVPVEWSVGDTILDLYEVTGVLGEGGMGKVYKVHHKGWNLDLAVKSPRPQILSKRGAVANFERECETWINLGLHPHIVSCFYVRRLGGIPRVFAEFVDGGSLKDWIEDGRLYEGGHKESLKRILDIAIQFAWGLHYAHEQGLIHQDVKPANLMMTANGIAKVTDFGMAKARALAGETSVAVPGQSILVSSGGMTPAYCSPEQANKQSLSRKTDIWSWGLSLLEMFTGDVIWPSGTVACSALDAYLADGRQNVSRPPMPDALADLLRQCFEDAPSARPRNLHEVASAMAELFRHVIEEGHSRTEPVLPESLASALNNRALSLLDLGRREEGLLCFRQALNKDPHHLEATYNQALLEWRVGKVDDVEAVRRLNETRTLHANDWHSELLLAQVHLERGDGESAVKMLEEALIFTPNEAQLQDTLERARSIVRDSNQCQRTIGEGLTEGNSSISLSGDGRIALSGHFDSTLKLWEIATGRCLQTLEGHANAILAVYLSSNCSWALSAGGSISGRSGDTTLKLWEVASGRTLRTLKGHAGGVNSVCLSGDSRWALSGSEDMTLKLWEIATGRCLRTFEGHKHYVRSVCLSNDSHWAISAGGIDKTFRLWEVATGRCLRTFDRHTDKVNSVCLSGDDRWVLSDAISRFLLLDLRGFVKSLIACPFETSLPVSSSEALDVQHQFHEALEAADRAMRSAVYATAAACIRHARSKPGCARLSEAVNKWAELYVRLPRTSFADGWEQTRFQGHTNSVCSVCLSGNSRWALSGSCDKTLKLWDVATGECLRTFEGHMGGVNSVCLSGNSRWALSGSGDGPLKLWDVATGQCLRTFEGHKGVVESVCFSSDGRWALSGSRDKALKLWDVATRRCLWTFKGHAGWVNSICLNGDSRWALSGSNDGALKLWDVATSHCLRTFEGHVGGLKAVCLSGDSRWALSAGGNDCSEEGTLMLWHVATGQCLRTFEGHMGVVESVCFSSDGRWALSGSRDNALKLWDVATGRCTRTFQRGYSGTSGAAASSVSISDDGRWALSAGDEHTVRLYFLDWGLEQRELADRDQGVQVYLEQFLTLHTPDASRLPDNNHPTEEQLRSALTRQGKPTWTDTDFERLLYDVGCAGYGWLRPEGVRRELEGMAANWTGPPPLFQSTGES
jgi:WD40 repeat protein